MDLEVNPLIWAEWPEVLPSDRYPNVKDLFVETFNNPHTPVVLEGDVTSIKQVIDMWTQKTGRCCHPAFRRSFDMRHGLMWLHGDDGDRNTRHRQNSRTAELGARKQSLPAAGLDQLCFEVSVRSVRLRMISSTSARLINELASVAFPS